MSPTGQPNSRAKHAGKAQDKKMKSGKKKARYLHLTPTSQPASQPDHIPPPQSKPINQSSKPSQVTNASE